MRRRDSDPHLLLGAWALDALDDYERARFEQHLRGCAACAAEVAAFGETTARLAAAATAEPPASLRDRTLSAAAHTSQLPPSVRDDAATRRWRSPVSRPARGRAAAVLVAAAVVAVAVLIGFTIATLQHRAAENQRHVNDVAAVLNAPDATVMKAPISTGGTATVVMSHQKEMLVFTATGLHPLPPSKGYELWLLRNSRHISAGMLPTPNSGSSTPHIAVGLAAGDRLGLSIEPARGSPAPTSSMILELPL